MREQLGIVGTPTQDRSLRLSTDIARTNSNRSDPNQVMQFKKSLPEPIVLTVPARKQSVAAEEHEILTSSENYTSSEIEPTS